MIKVTCIVADAEKKTKDYLLVKSCDDLRDVVYLSIEGIDAFSKHTGIRINADDLIQAVENCRNNGFRRFPTRYNYNRCKQNDDDEDNE